NSCLHHKDAARLQDLFCDLSAKCGLLFFFFSSRRRHTRWPRDWSSDVCSSDLSEKRSSSVTRTATAITSWILRRTTRSHCRKTWLATRKIIWWKIFPYRSSTQKADPCR